MNHFNTVDRIVSFKHEILPDTLVKPEDIRGEFETRNLRPAREAWTNASEQSVLLLADQTKDILQTVTNYFADTLSATRQDRILHRLTVAVSNHLLIASGLVALCRALSGALNRKIISILAILIPVIFR